MRRLWREHARHHRAALTAVLILTAVMAGLTGLYPVVIARALSMFEARDTRILYQIPALVVIITSAKAAAQYGQTVTLQRLVLTVIRELQEEMFAHLMRADLARLEREAPAALAARFTTDANTVREAMVRAVNAIGDAVTVVSLVASMVYLDWQFSLIAAALYPLAAVPIQRVGRKVRRASGGMQERMGETSSLLTESFAQARTVRAYRLEEAEIRRSRLAFHQLFRSLLRMTRSRARVDPFLEILGGAAVALVLGFAGWRAAHGGNTLGDFAGFVAALLTASRPIRALGALNSAIQEGSAGLARIFGVIDEQPHILERPHAAPLPQGSGHLRFEDVQFVYPDGRIGLDRLSFEALPGLTVALVGPSGAGKSTALTLIPRLIDVSGGRITLDGADVRDVTLTSLRDAIAYVGQDTLLFDDTVAANIRMGRPDASEDAVWPPKQPPPRVSSVFCLRVCRRWSAQAACAFRAGSGSGWRWRARCCAIRASCCSTKRPAPWTRKARPRCNWPSAVCASAAPPSWSPTDYRRCVTPTWSWHWRTARRASRAPTPN
jgi:subfamily B ATP-binding cassette protein MsbA